MLEGGSEEILGQLQSNDVLCYAAAGTNRGEGGDDLVGITSREGGNGGGVRGGGGEQRGCFVLDAARQLGRGAGGGEVPRVGGVITTVPIETAFAPWAVLPGVCGCVGVYGCFVH